MNENYTSLYETLITLGVVATSIRSEHDRIITHVLFTGKDGYMYKHMLAEPTHSEHNALHVAVGSCVIAVLNLGTEDGKVFTPRINTLK
ncbi:hypothetical protein LCGC14_1510910 [marine sediment metagenome]|uniref:Uncharacterized protein n=1 Tax=marine sediment metagenome TaxID=412755 RepID=A0A0F9LGV2_9ZZZZ